VEKDHRLAIGRPGRRDVHVGHAQVLPLDSEREQLNRVGIGQALERDSERLGRRSGRRGGEERGEREGEHDLVT
jgi:hypothetical protein